MTTTPTLWKFQTTANTSPGSQSPGRVAALSDGGYVLAWSDTGNTYNPLGAAVVGQRYDVFGEKVGGEFKISSFNNGNQSVSGMAMMPTGGALVAWNDSFDNNSQRDVYVSYYSSTFAFPRRDIIDNSLSQTFNIVVTPFADGSYAAVYLDQVSSTDRDVVGRIVSADGTVGPRFDILNEASSPKGQLDIATLSSGNFVVTFGRGADSDPDDVVFTILTPTGQFVVGPTFITGGADVATEDDASVAALAGGGFVVAWTDNAGDSDGAGVRATIYTATGALGPRVNFIVNPEEAGSQYTPDVVGLADGGFVVTWKDRLQAFDIAQRFDALGNPVGERILVKAWGDAGENAGDSQIHTALLGDGRYAYAISHRPDGQTDVVTSIWDPRDTPVNGTAADDIMTNRVEGGLINGLAGADRLLGSGNPDTLDGGSGPDTLEGGIGDDTYLVDGGDTIRERHGEGEDTVITAASFVLSGEAELETLIFTGDRNTRGTGNGIANRITGNGGDNTLLGGLGDDTLTGSAGEDELRGQDGADRMNGGPGNDRYFVDNAGDLVIETSATGGIDTVFSAINLVLGANLEVLRLQGSAAINGNGNALNNKVFGNAGDNVLKGLDGNDTIDGKGGADTIFGGAGNDTLTGGAKADLFVFARTNAGVDRILDFAGNGRTGDGIDLSGGLFTALTIAANGDAVLTHSGGAVRIANPPDLTLDEWNAIVMLSGEQSANPPVPFIMAEGRSFAAFDTPASPIHAAHPDWALA